MFAPVLLPSLMSVICYTSVLYRMHRADIATTELSIYFISYDSIPTLALFVLAPIIQSGASTIGLHTT